MKTIRSPDPEEQALLIIDCCAALIAKTVLLPVNQVKLLPSQEPWSNCQWYKQLATLHQWAPGQSCEDSLPWEGFTVQQRFNTQGSLQWKRWGPVPENKKGLSQQVITTMSCHNDLARIVAFDTFIGNGDRSLPNLYYNKEDQTFFAIDMAAAFRRPLAQVAIKQLQRLSRKGFSQKELAGLKIYHQTLMELQKAISPSLVKNWLESLGKQSQLKGISHRLQAASENFSNNYMQVKELINLLDSLCT